MDLCRPGFVYDGQGLQAGVWIIWRDVFFR